MGDSEISFFCIGFCAMEELSRPGVITDECEILACSLSPHEPVSPSVKGVMVASSVENNVNKVMSVRHFFPICGLFLSKK